MYVAIDDIQFAALKVMPTFGCVEWASSKKTLPSKKTSLVSPLYRSSPRLTEPTLRVLEAILSSGLEEISGTEISNTTKLASGTLYPILLRLEQAKWLESRWENGLPQELRRPRRRLYSVTALGAHCAKQALEKVASAFGELAWQ
jgi:DNA-binding PadR family transcriptional regulator